MPRRSSKIDEIAHEIRSRPGWHDFPRCLNTPILPKVKLYRIIEKISRVQNLDDFLRHVQAQKVPINAERLSEFHQHRQAIANAHGAREHSPFSYVTQATSPNSEIRCPMSHVVERRISPHVPPMSTSQTSPAPPIQPIQSEGAMGSPTLPAGPAVSPEPSPYPKDMSSALTLQRTTSSNSNVTKTFSIPDKHFGLEIAPKDLAQTYPSPASKAQEHEAQALVQAPKPGTGPISPTTPVVSILADHFIPRLN